jgi:hypothetical protein
MPELVTPDSQPSSSKCHRVGTTSPSLPHPTTLVAPTHASSTAAVAPNHRCNPHVRIATLIHVPLHVNEMGEGERGTGRKGGCREGIEFWEIVWGSAGLVNRARFLPILRCEVVWGAAVLSLNS